MISITAESLREIRDRAAELMEHPGAKQLSNHESEMNALRRRIASGDVEIARLNKVLLDIQAAQDRRRDELKYQTRRVSDLRRNVEQTWRDA